MRLTRLVASSFLLAVSLVSGQWLEKTIYLPDSFGGLTMPQCLAYNSANNTIYVGGEYGRCIIAIDGATNQKIARIPSGCGTRDLCYNPRDNRVYCAEYDNDTVTVIDGASNQVIATVTVRAQPTALCYNSNDNKVYCANYLSNEVSVIDCASNRVLATIEHRVLAMRPLLQPCRQ
jgi:YVTN family beta-propeller protein